MKKIVLLLTVFALFNTKGNAQEVSFGAKAGLNLAGMTYSGEGTDAINDASKMRTAFHLGGMAELKLSDFISIQPELLFSSQGSKMDESEEKTTTTGPITTVSKSETKMTMITNYIAVPVMGKFYVAEGLGLEVGPQIGFLMSAKSKGESSTSVQITGQDTITSNNSYDEDAKEDVNSIDFGMNAGVSYKLESGLNFGARYNFGFSNIAKDAGDDFKAKNNVIQISVGYFFN